MVLNDSGNYNLIVLHKPFLDDGTLQSICEQCVSILQEEWPRAEALRRRSISRSCDSLPCSFALITKLYPYTAVGYCQISAVPGLPECCLLESVVIKKDLRGKGYGRLLVELVQKYIQIELNPPRSRIVLTAKPEQAQFYRRLGYSSCEPIAYSSGAASNFIPQAFLERLAAANNNKAAETCRLFESPKGSGVHRTTDVEWLHLVLS